MNRFLVPSVLAAAFVAFATPVQAQVNISGALAAGDTILPGPDRLFRNGTASACGLAKSFPGTLPAAGERYDEYVVTNNGAAQCITFTVTTVSGACTGGTHLTAYSGAFVPANVATGYLGDSGTSATSGVPQTLSLDLSAGQTIRLVASNGISGASDCTYTVTAPAGVLGTGGAGAVAQVPTLGEWGLMLLGLLAAGFGARRLPRQRG